MKATVANMPVFQIPQKSIALVDCLNLAMKINGPVDSSPIDQEDCQGSACSASTPPLDLVTLGSEDCSDDVSSVSSCSINEDPENDFSSYPPHNSCSPSTPRSIFKRYWGTQDEQQGHTLHRPLPTEISTHFIRLLTEEENPAPQNVYEETLREREQDAQPGLVPKRRSIFSNQYKSNSSPSFRSQKYLDLRKIQSASALGPKPTKSCLRLSRFSGSDNDLRLSQRSSGSDNAVRFSQKVEVTLFHPSLERYAQEGWSDFFAYR